MTFARGNVFWMKRGQHAGMSNEQIARIMEMRAGGAKWKAISRVFNRHPVHLKRCVVYAEKYGLDWKKQMNLEKRK